MNITKLLCKYLDEENKGYVNGEDIVQFTGAVSLMCILLTIIFAHVGDFIKVDLMNVGGYSITFYSLLNPINVLIGLIAITTSGIVVVVVHKLIKTFSKHKFVICDRDNN